jgi:hypothetical protein
MVTLQELKDFIKKVNEEGGSNFILKGAYGNLELWDNDENRIEVGSKKEIYSKLIRVRFNEKYRRNK